MYTYGQLLRILPATIAILGLAACAGEPRAVLLPLQYPDGTPVQTMAGDAVMAGYQTYGSPMHANATALYANAAPTTCLTCAKVVGIVSEPSDLRQATGLLGASTVGAGAVMGGLGAMNYGNAALDGKLGTNVNQTTVQSNSRTDNGNHRDNNFHDQDNNFHDRDNNFHER